MFVALVSIVGAGNLAYAQQDGLLQINDPIHRFLLRQQTAGHLSSAILSHQPLSAYEAQRYLDSLATNGEGLSTRDRRALARFRGTTPSVGARRVNNWADFLYRNGRDFYSFSADDFALQLNPLAYVTYGQASWETVDSAPVWLNVRGVRLSGHVGRYVYFESRFEEIQQRPPRPEAGERSVARERNVGHLAPGFEKQSDDIFDYGRTMGVVGFRTPHFEIRFGRDRNKWGNGINSLFLSNYAPVYEELQIRTTFWRLQYVNLFTAMEDYPGGSPIPRKYGTLHQLGIDLPGRVQLNLFQSVIFIPDTLKNRRPGFDIAMLNPIVVMHQIEKAYQSQGNLAMGLEAAWGITDGVRAYGQFLITEFVLNEFFNDDGFWANKRGAMAGIHLVDLPLNGLDLRFEYARVRPFTYSHHGSANYVHYSYVLGHPAGQNMVDYSLFVSYPFADRISVSVNAAITRRGRDTETENYGGDPRTSYNTRVSDYGNELLQGVRQRQNLVEARIDYEILPGCYLAGELLVDATDDAETGLERIVATTVALRWGLPFRSRRY